MIDLTIINVAGDIMYRQDYAGDHQTKIDCSAYANGVYFLKINHKEGVMIHKIIKK